MLGKCLSCRMRLHLFFAPEFLQENVEIFSLFFDFPSKILVFWIISWFYLRKCFCSAYVCAKNYCFGGRLENSYCCFLQSSIREHRSFKLSAFRNSAARPWYSLDATETSALESIGQFSVFHCRFYLSPTRRIFDMVPDFLHVVWLSV